MSLLNCWLVYKANTHMEISIAVRRTTTNKKNPIKLSVFSCRSTTHTNTDVCVSVAMGTKGGTHTHVNQLNHRCTCIWLQQLQRPRQLPVACPRQAKDEGGRQGTNVTVPTSMNCNNQIENVAKHSSHSPSVYNYTDCSGKNLTRKKVCKFHGFKKN